MPFRQESPVTLSPNGTMLAYLTPSGITVRTLDSFEARVLPNTTGAMTPMFSPDSSRIAFFQLGDLKWVPVEGGPAVTVRSVGTPGGVGSAWVENSFLIVGIGSNGIMSIPEGGGQPTPLTHVSAEEGENIHAWPAGLPGESSILYTALGPGGGWEDGRTVLFDPDTGERQVLVEGGTQARYSPTGHILYVEETGTVFARPFDLQAREWTGPAEAVVSDVRTSTWGGGASYHVSDTGVLAWLDGSEFEGNRLVTLDRTGAEIREYGASTADYLTLSRDGTRVLISQPTGNNIDVWIHDLETGGQDRFTFDINEEEASIWSPNDDRIMWGSAQAGGGRLAFVQAVDRAADPEVVFEHAYHMHVTDWSEDGRYVTFYDFHPTQGSNVYLVDLEDGGRVIPLAATDADESEARFSPDGRWLAYSSDETGRFEIFVVSVPDGAQKRQVSDGGGFLPRWDRRGRELFYLTEGWNTLNPPILVARQVVPGDALNFGATTPLFSLPSTVGFEPDLEGTRFHTFLARPESYAYDIRVLMNWMAELEGE